MVNSIIVNNRAESPIFIASREDGVLLKTCARTELYWGDGDVPADVARHLFRVAAGLESPLLGEQAILGQIKQSYFEARKSGKLSSAINKLFQTASYVGHRVRTETGIARGAVSYSQVTVDILCNELPDLGNKVVSVIGVNELTESILNFLIARGATNILLANRSLDKAEEIAHKYDNVEAFSLSEKQDLFSLSDVIISATSAPHTIIKSTDLPSGKPQLLFDLANPQDIEDDVTSLSGKTLFNLQQIEHLAQQNLQKRANEVGKCEVIIEEEIANLQHWQQYRKKLVG